ncbi:hypothetical protein DY000_02059776 [Brassica cretica]|uniref:Uncharacterized protein n=1 Tax=Brassica cretica TaxID=69181 RepID=A0ABQ7AWQ6_BRACR|nr:hypothetical protein DY000_02059776 [Brassica cretica]
MVPKFGYHSYTEDTGVEVSRTGRDQVELAGRADSRDGRTRRRAQPHDGSARRQADRRDGCARRRADRRDARRRADRRDGSARRRADPRDGSALRRVAFVRDSLGRSLPIFLSVNVLREIRE